MQNPRIVVRSMLLLLLCGGTVFVHAANLDVTVVTLDGEEQPRKLTAITETGFKFESGETAFADISELRFTASSVTPEKTHIHLRNGDVISAHVISGDDSKLKFTCAFGDISLDNKWLDAIEFTLKDGPSGESVTGFLKAPPAREDQLLLPKGDTASGFLEKFTDKDLSFNAGGQSHVYAFDKVAALRLAPLEKFTPSADVRATLILKDDSHISAKLASLSGEDILFEGIGALQWKIHASDIKSIIFKGGKLVYLSDLAPKTVQEMPYAGGMPVIYHWRRNQSVTGGKLSINGKDYERGFGVHSFCKLVFDLGSQYAKLSGDVGLDKDALPSSVCAWRVIADGKEVASGVAKPDAATSSLKLDVHGVSTLELICDYGPDDDDAGDHLDWVNLRLLKP